MKVIVITVAIVAAALSLATNRANAALPSDVSVLMDSSTDPCEDFYQFSCGGWIKKARIPDGEVRALYPNDLLDNQTEHTINKIFEERHPVLGEFYDSCLDTKKTATANGNKPIQAALSKIQHASSKVELAKVAGELCAEGSCLLTSFGFINDDRDPRWNALIAQSAGSPLDDVPDSKLDAATKYILTSLKLGGATPLDSEQDARKDMLRFKQAEKRFPLGFKAIADGARIRAKSAIKDDSVVFIKSLTYFDTIETQIWNAKSLDEIKFFLLFVYISEFAQFLGDVFLQNEKEYRRYLAERVGMCRGLAWKTFPDLINEYLFKKELGAQTQQHVKAMAQTLNAQMADFISKQNWMSVYARGVAQKKLQNMIIFAGKQDLPVSYPLKLKADAYIDNYRAISQFQFDVGLRGIEMLADRTKWDGDPGEATICYDPRLIRLRMTTSMLQPPFFSTSYHIARQYGALATSITAMLALAFGSDSIQFDSAGAKRDWLTEIDKREFNKRWQCFRDQYNKYEVRGSKGNVLGHLNGSFVLDSALSDDSGIRFGFRGLQQFLAKNPNTPTQGVTRNEINRLFFIATAQQWCAKSTDASLLDTLMFAPHGPPAARVNAVLSNVDEFAETFKCKKGTRMNSNNNKCGFWK